MWVVEGIVALLVALMIPLVFLRAYGGRLPNRQEPAATVLFLFLTGFLVVWAGAVWTAPLDHGLLEGPLLPFLGTGLLIALLIVTLMPRRPPEHREEEKEAEQRRAQISGLIGASFWVLLAVLIVIGMLHYMARG